MNKSGWRLREEKEWYRYYESPAHPYIYESKFATGEASISPADLQARWQNWNEGEQVQFAQAFCWKSTLSSEDELILDFLMRQDGEMISSSIAVSVAKLSDKKRAAQFLVHCLRTFPKTRGNFLLGLGNLAEPETVSDLSLVFEECNKSIAQNAQDYDSVADLLYCSDALFRITAQAQYRDVIAYYMQHPEKRVRGVAEMLLRAQLRADT